MNLMYNLMQIEHLTDGGTDWIKDIVPSEHLADHYIYPNEIDFDKKKINIFYLGRHGMTE